MSEFGWIRLDRRVFSQDMRGDSAMILTWTFLLAHAAWKPTSARWQGRRIMLEPGQLVATIVELCEWTGLTRKQVRRAIKGLTEGQRMAIQGTNHGHLITICNYSEYNGIEREQRANRGPTEGQPRANQGPTEPVNTNNNHLQGREHTPRAGARALEAPPQGATEAEATDNPLPDFALEAGNFDSEALYGVWWTWTMRKMPNKQYEPDFGPSSFRGAVDQVVRETGITHEKLREVFEFASNSSFWHRLIYHPRWMLWKKEGMLRIEQIVGQMKTKTQFELEKLAQLSEGNGQQHPNYGHTDENGNWTPF